MSKTPLPAEPRHDSRPQIIKGCARRQQISARPIVWSVGGQRAGPPHLVLRVDQGEEAARASQRCRNLIGIFSSRELSPEYFHPYMKRITGRRLRRRSRLGDHRALAYGCGRYAVNLNYLFSRHKIR